MSVAALLAEVTPITGLTTVIAAADAVYLKERPIYSDVKPQSSSSHGGHKNEGGHHKNNRGASEDKVNQAIDEAKKTATNARRNNRGRASHKSESGELAALRHEVEALKLDNADLHRKLDQLLAQANLTSAPGSAAPAPAAAAAPAPAAADDDFDLFGSDEEDDAEKQRITEERLKAYAEKKSKKPGPIAKSNIIYDVKPWDDTIKTEDIEAAVRGIEMEGLVWGAAKKVPVAFGIIKLQICCVVEDEKVSSDALEEAITGFEDLVQSVDVVAFNKV